MNLILWPGYDDDFGVQYFSWAGATGSTTQIVSPFSILIYIAQRLSAYNTTNATTTITINGWEYP
jgi:hypothetical protein